MFLLEFEREQREKMNAELEAFENQLEDEEEEEKKKNEKAILALNARKEALLKEKKAKAKQEMEKMSKQGASKEDQEAVLKEHSKDLAKLMNKMDADRMRMQSSLEERLKKKREAKKTAKVQELTNKMDDEKIEYEEKQQAVQEREQVSVVVVVVLWAYYCFLFICCLFILYSDYLSVLSVNEYNFVHSTQAKEVIALKESIQVDNLVSETIKSDAPAPPPPKPTEMPSSYQLTAPLSEGELTGMLMSSPLYQKLESIKSLLKGGAGKGGGGPAGPSGKGGV